MARRCVLAGMETYDIRVIKKETIFVSKWLVNLHLTFIFIVVIDVVTCIYM